MTSEFPLKHLSCSRRGIQKKLLSAFAICQVLTSQNDSTYQSGIFGDGMFCYPSVAHFSDSFLFIAE